MPKYSPERNKKVLFHFFLNGERLKDFFLVLAEAVDVLFSLLERSVLPEDNSLTGLPSQNSSLNAPWRREGIPANFSCCQRNVLKLI